MATQIFLKFMRPERPRGGRLSDRDLDIIEAVMRYRFSPASQLVRLVGGNEDVTHRRLRWLWESRLINRWAFPGIRSHSEFHYYLDNREALNLLVEHCRLAEVSPQIAEEVRNNREKDYAMAAMRGQHMQLGFLQHSLMVSRMHFMLDLACRGSGGSLKLVAWGQGAQLAGHKVQAPAVKSGRQGNGHLWWETDEVERLPVEPDGLFSLRFRDRPQDQQLSHFFYEADRGTMNMTDMLKKLRAYYHFVKKQQKHKEAFGVHPIRAVLIETTDEARAKKLMELVNHPLVCGPGNRTGLFWFTISELFTDDIAAPAPQALRPYLAHPEIILQPIWALPDRTRHALDDAENSPKPSRPVLHQKGAV